MNDHEIRIGLSVSTSGRFRFQGQQALKGILLWQSHVNATGGVFAGRISRPVRLIWYDDESRASRTRENVLRLLRDDGVDILFGPYSSNLAMAAAEIAEEHKHVLWNYGGTSDEIFNQGWQYIVGISSPASDYFRRLPHWLNQEHPELRRICVLYSARGTFGRQVNRGVIETARETGRSVHSVPLNDPIENSDAVPSTLGEINPEAVVLASNLEDELAIMRTRLRWPITVRVTAAVAAGISSFGSQLGQASNGLIGPSQWEVGVRFPTFAGPSSGWFENSFQKEFDTAPNYVAAASFATGLLVVECIFRADSLNNDRLRCVASQLDCTTFYGRFRIDPRSGKQLGHRVLLIRWQNGTKAVLVA